jgi:hypothetical protein
VTAQYAKATVHFHNTVTGRDETVQAGALKDSATQAVVQVPSLFTSSPLTTSGLPPAVVSYLTAHTAGP